MRRNRNYQFYLSALRIKQILHLARFGKSPLFVEHQSGNVGSDRRDQATLVYCQTLIMATGNGSVYPTQIARFWTKCRNKRASEGSVSGQMAVLEYIAGSVRICSLSYAWWPCVCADRVARWSISSSILKGWSWDGIDWSEDCGSNGWEKDTSSVGVSAPEIVLERSKDTGTRGWIFGDGRGSVEMDLSSNRRNLVSEDSLS